MRFFLLILFIGASQIHDSRMQNTQPPELEFPSIVIRKSERVLQLFDGNHPVRTFPIVLGSTPVGDKRAEGDGRTPEGEFYIFTKNPDSRYHLSLGISYPAVDDAERGLREKLITEREYNEIVAAIAEKRMPPQKTRLGGEIYIHGGGTEGDWTDGCVALTNEMMTELYVSISVGTRVEIKP
jgi:murein L,D-transpeptidase YafK